MVVRSCWPPVPRETAILLASGRLVEHRATTEEPDVGNRGSNTVQLCSSFWASGVAMLHETMSGGIPNSSWGGSSCLRQQSDTANQDRNSEVFKLVR